ncbi:MAG: asparagine synthase [Candidatus Aminicenantes bacterium]|nr:asparagine synthase [Candidatus Aminicenantes bacterium]
MKKRFSENLGIVPRFYEFGDVDKVFFYSNHGDTAESESGIVFKSGFLRSLDSQPLSAQNILEQKLIGPDSVNQLEFTGNALLVLLSKKNPAFSIYKTLLSLPQLFYSISKDEIICSDRLNCLVRTLPHVELNEDILPMHFLYRIVMGPLTHFRDIHRLMSGQFMRWKEGVINFQLLRDFRFEEREPRIRRIDESSLDMIYGSLRKVISDAVRQISISGQGLASLMSGGVDSSLIQVILNEITPGGNFPSFSFNPNAPCFAPEIGYLREGLAFFQTKHTFVDLDLEKFPDLIKHSASNLAQPPSLASLTALEAIAQFVKENHVPIRYFTSGQGGDSVWGTPPIRNAKILNEISRIPMASSMLKFLGKTLKSVYSGAEILTKRSEKLNNWRNPHSPLSPVNTLDVYIELEDALELFGEKQLLGAMEYRFNLSRQYLNTDHLLEQLMVIDLLTDCYEQTNQQNLLYMAHNTEIVCPYLDEEIVELPYRFEPDIRYIKGFNNKRVKYLLKSLLQRRADLSTIWKPKRATTFHEDLFEWMRDGSLKPLIHEIDLPGFLSKDRFEKMTRNPDMFLWELLSYDIFKKSVSSN